MPGPTSINFSKDIDVKEITNANEMMDAVQKLLPVDVAVCAAAVADFKNQVAQLSIEIAEKVVKSELSEKDKQFKMVKSLLQDVTLK